MALINGIMYETQEIINIASVLIINPICYACTVHLC